MLNVVPLQTPQELALDSFEMFLAALGKLLSGLAGFLAEFSPQLLLLLLLLLLLGREKGERS